MNTILRFDGVDFYIYAEQSFEKIINNYFIGSDNLEVSNRKINISYGGICECDEYKTNKFLMLQNNYMDVEYKIYKEEEGIINYVSEDRLYGRHVYRKISGNDYEVYSIDNSEKNGMQWVIRLIRELLLEKNMEEGFVPVHASGIEIEGNAVLFIGNKGSGKTTSMFSCATNDKCNVISNDMVFVRVEGDEIYVKGWPWCVTIGNELMAETKFAYLIDKNTSKVRFTPKEFSEKTNCKWAWKSSLKKVVFPQIVVGKSLTSHKLENKKANSRLINEGTEFDEIPLLLKRKIKKLNFTEVFNYIAQNVSCVVIEGEFWKYKDIFIDYICR